MKEPDLLEYTLTFHMYEGEEGYQKPHIKCGMTIKAIDCDNAQLLGDAIANNMEGNWFALVED